MYYCYALFNVYVALSPGIGPIVVGNTYIIYIYIYTAPYMKSEPKMTLIQAKCKGFGWNSLV
jgi:hypothetical protein